LASVSRSTPAGAPDVGPASTTVVAVPITRQTRMLGGWEGQPLPRVSMRLAVPLKVME